MSLAFLLYLGNVLNTLGFIFAIIGVLLFSALPLWFICLDGDVQYNLQKHDIKHSDIKFFAKLHVVLVILCISISIFLPSERTFRQIIAANYIEKNVDIGKISEITDKALKILDKKMDDLSKEVADEN